MKTIQDLKRVLLLSGCAVALAGCGAAENISRACGGSLDIVCDTVFGADADTVEENSVRVAQLEGRIELLKDDIYANTQLIEDLEADITADVTNLQNAVNSMYMTLSVLQNDVNTLEGRVDVLDSYDVPVGYIDPCGDGPGFDEAIIQTRFGNLIAYFKENGSREFLTILSPGNYRTTDKQKCNFTVTPVGDLLD